jgi:hypothetical protein
MPLKRAGMKLQPYLRGSLWAGGFLIVILLVASALWLALAAAGDVAGSQGAKGVTLVALVCLALDQVVLVVLLALTELTRPPTDDQPKRQPSAEHPLA